MFSFITKLDPFVNLLLVLLAAAVMWGSAEKTISTHSGEIGQLESRLEKDEEDIQYSKRRSESIEKLESRQNQAEININQTAISLGRIEQKIDDLRCADSGKGCR